MPRHFKQLWTAEWRSVFRIALSPLLWPKAGGKWDTATSMIAKGTRFGGCPLLFLRLPRVERHCSPIARRHDPRLLRSPPCKSEPRGAPIGLTETLPTAERRCCGSDARFSCAPPDRRRVSDSKPGGTQFGDRTPVTWNQKKWFQHSHHHRQNGTRNDGLYRRRATISVASVYWSIWVFDSLGNLYSDLYEQNLVQQRVG